METFLVVNGLFYLSLKSNSDKLEFSTFLFNFSFLCFGLGCLHIYPSRFKTTRNIFRDGLRHMKTTTSELASPSLSFHATLTELYLVFIKMVIKYHNNIIQSRIQQPRDYLGFMAGGSKVRVLIPRKTTLRHIEFPRKLCYITNILTSYEAHRCKVHCGQLAIKNLEFEQTQSHIKNHIIKLNK